MQRIIEEDQGEREDRPCARRHLLAEKQKIGLDLQMGKKGHIRMWREDREQAVRVRPFSGAIGRFCQDRA